MIDLAKVCADALISTPGSILINESGKLDDGPLIVRRLCDILLELMLRTDRFAEIFLYLTSYAYGNAVIKHAEEIRVPIN